MDKAAFYLVVANGGFNLHSSWFPRFIGKTRSYKHPPQPSGIRNAIARADAYQSKTGQFGTQTRETLEDKGDKVLAAQFPILGW